jgi:hypothetical protein
VRVWGRVTATDGTKTWVEVSSNSQSPDAVYITALAQVLKLNLNESPFYANFGIPQYQSIQQQVPPHYWVMKIQQRYAPFFASLAIIPQTGTNPTYLIRAVLHSGAAISVEVPV